MSNRTAPISVVMLLAPFLLCGCQALYFLQGKGTQKALFKLPKDQRILVFVDTPPSVSLPAGYAASLGEEIGAHLYKYKAATTVATQDRLTAMRSDPTFIKLGVADVAKATGADVVVYVNVVTFNVALISGDAVSRGDAQALIKVIDKNGARLWPLNQPAGQTIEAHLDEALSDQRDQAATLKQIGDQLTNHAGRLFHDYSLDDPEMTK